MMDGDTELAKTTPIINIIKPVPPWMEAWRLRDDTTDVYLMMEQLKTIRDASQAAYDASSALQSNVQVSRPLFVLLDMLPKTFLFRNLY